MTSIWTNELNNYWDESILTQSKEFRVEESVLKQHSLASLQQPEWRVAYGIDGPEARHMALDIDYRREHGISLAGLKWSPSDDPYAPANDPHHLYYLG